MAEHTGSMMPCTESNRHLRGLHGDGQRAAIPEGYKVGVHSLGSLLDPFLTPKACCNPFGYSAPGRQLHTGHHMLLDTDCKPVHHLESLADRLRKQ